MYAGHCFNNDSLIVYIKTTYNFINVHAFMIIITKYGNSAIVILMNTIVFPTDHKYGTCSYLKQTMVIFK